MKVKTKKVLVGALVMIFTGLIISTIFFFKNVLYGKEVETSNARDYGSFECFNNMSALAVFPAADASYMSQDYYYQLKDEINSPKCQIYLKRQYTAEQYKNEIERIEKWELSYLDQTHRFYKDNSQYISTAYVAVENYNNCYEYALVFENINTIIYVYLKNIDINELYMEKMFLPAYLQNNTTNSEWKNTYAFLIGSKYVVCMDLAE